MDNQSTLLKVLSFSQLSKTKLKEVKSFVSQGKRLEGYVPVFYWGSIENRKNPGVNELLCYNHQNNLIGYLSLYHFEEQEIEITAFIHPEYQKETVYQDLWAELKRVVAKFPVEIKRYTITCNQENLAFKEHLNRLGAFCYGVTHKLGLSLSQYQKMNLSVQSALEYQKAVPADIPALLELQMGQLQTVKACYQYYLEESFQDPNQMIMKVLKSGKILAKIHLQLEKNSVYLFDLCIKRTLKPEFEELVLLGLLEVLFLEMKFKKVLVDVVDQKGLILYKKLKFKCLTTYEHWKAKVFVDPLKQREKQLEELILNFQCYQVQDQLSQSDYKH